MAISKQAVRLLRNCNSQPFLPAKHIFRSTFVTDVDENYKNAKPFNEIPGPKGLPYFGTLLQFKRGTYYYSFAVAE
jgi:hypothetical protein